MSENNRSEGGSGGAGAGLRASDEDRERLADELRDHAVAGRLDTDELEERLQATYAARTTGELQALRRDLPATPAQLALAHRKRRAQLTRRMLQESGGSLGLFVLCVGIWAASGASGSFWPVWVLLVFALSVVRNGWGLWGPDADLDRVEAALDHARERRGQERDRHVERHAERHARHREQRGRDL